MKLLLHKKTFDNHMSRCHFPPPICPHFKPLKPLANNNTLLSREAVPGHLQIQGRRPLPNPPTDIIMAPMARTEPPAVVPGLPNGHAPQMRADAQHDEPVGLLHAVAVRLRVPEGLPVFRLGVFDLGVGAVADEDGFAAPFDNDLNGGRVVNRLIRDSRSDVRICRCALRLSQRQI